MPKSGVADEKGTTQHAGSDNKHNSMYAPPSLIGRPGTTPTAAAPANIHQYSLPTGSKKHKKGVKDRYLTKRSRPAPRKASTNPADHVHVPAAVTISLPDKTRLKPVLSRRVARTVVYSTGLYNQLPKIQKKNVDSKSKVQVIHPYYLVYHTHTYKDGNVRNKCANNRLSTLQCIIHADSVIVRDPYWPYSQPKCKIYTKLSVM